jgi:hypothetical protein
VEPGIHRVAGAGHRFLVAPVTSQEPGQAPGELTRPRPRGPWHTYPARRGSWHTRPHTRSATGAGKRHPTPEEPSRCHNHPVGWTVSCDVRGGCGSRCTMPDPGSASCVRRTRMLLDGPADEGSSPGRAYVMQTDDKTRIGDDGPRLPGLAQPRNEGLRGISQADLRGYFSMFLSDSRRGDISHA